MSVYNEYGIWRAGLGWPDKSFQMYSKGEQFVCDGVTCFTLNECKGCKGAGHSLVA